MMTEPDPAPPGSKVQVLVFVLITLTLAAGYEGWLLREQGRRLDALETLADRNRGHILQISHAITGDQAGVQQALRNLKRDIAALDPSLPKGDPNPPVQP